MLVIHFTKVMKVVMKAKKQKCVNMVIWFKTHHDVAVSRYTCLQENTIMYYYYINVN